MIEEEKWFDTTITLTLKQSEEDKKRINKLLSSPIYCFNSIEEFVKFTEERDKNK